MTIIPTYPSGYSGAKRTIHQIRHLPDVDLLSYEFRRRIFVMMRAARRAGVDLGIGGGGRTAAQQETLFLARHFPVPSGGCCTYQGKRYALRDGAAHAAPPGLSYHEPTTPTGKALAADMIGDLVWMNANCGWFGLAHFAQINNEPWHIQPIEIPRSRGQYVAATMFPLKRWG